MIASRSETVLPAGFRAGKGGRKYFNIEGKANGEYMSFGVLVFDIPKELQDKKVKSARLTLVQSIAQFAKDGAIQIFLAPELDLTREFKFQADVPGGVGDQIKPLQSLVSGHFKKMETGTKDLFSLTLDDSAQSLIARGGKLCLVIVPTEPAVAATYFGANLNDQASCPRLVFELP